MQRIHWLEKRHKILNGGYDEKTLKVWARFAFHRQNQKPEQLCQKGEERLVIIQEFQTRMKSRNARQQA